MSQRRSSIEPDDERETCARAAYDPVEWEKLHELLEGLPPGIPILSREDANEFEKYTNRPRHVYSKGEAWANCAQVLEKYDSELCKGYREEIDTLLVFAGLFSAVITAFTIESYQWLQTDADDAVLLVLSQIARSVSINSSDLPLVHSSSGLPDSVSLRINVYWFLALSLGLSAALVAILCKQWIREFERNTGLSPQKFVGIHQTKLEGLEKWRVGGIISLLPLLLQLALALFALGVLELLWKLNSTVAAIVCIPTIVSFVFYAATTVLPVLQCELLEFTDQLSFWQRFPECPYKSPQAMLVIRIWQFCLRAEPTLARALAHLAEALSLRTGPRSFWRHKSRLPLFHSPSWMLLAQRFNSALDRAYKVLETPLPTSHFRSLQWMRMNLDDGTTDDLIYQCLWDTGWLDETRIPICMIYPDNSQRHIEQKSLMCNLSHVCGGTVGLESGPDGLRLAGMSRTRAPPMFVVEVFIQNLCHMSTASALYAAGEVLLKPDARPAEHADEGLLVSLLKATTRFAQWRIEEDIGQVLYYVMLFAGVSEYPYRQNIMIFDACMLRVYLIWLRARRVSQLGAAVETTKSVLRRYLAAVVFSCENYDAHPERLAERSHVRELAELLDRYAHMTGCFAHKDPVGAIADDLGEFSSSGLAPRTVIRALLSLSPRGNAIASAVPTFQAGVAVLAHAPNSHIPEPTQAPPSQTTERDTARQGVEIEEESPSSTCRREAAPLVQHQDPSARLGTSAVEHKPDATGSHRGSPNPRCTHSVPTRDGASPETYARARGNNDDSTIGCP